MGQDQWLDFNPFANSQQWQEFNPFPTTPYNPTTQGMVDNFLLSFPDTPRQNAGMGLDIFGPTTPIRPVDGPKMSAPPQKGILDYGKDAWNSIWTPLSDFGSRMVEPWANFLQSVPEVPMTEIPSGYEDVPAQSAGVNDPYAGLVRTGGAFADSLTAPGNIAMGVAAPIRAAAGTMAARSTPALASQLRGIETTADVTMKGLGGGLAVEGGINMLHPDSTPMERGLGFAQTVMGTRAALPGWSVSFDPVTAKPASASPSAPRLTGGVVDDIAGTTEIRPPSGGLPKEIIIDDWDDAFLTQLKNQGYQHIGYTNKGEPILKISDSPESGLATPNDVDNINFDMSGSSLMTSERVQQVYGMNPREAMDQGLIVPEGNGYRANVKFVNQDPNLNQGMGDPELAGSSGIMPTGQSSNKINITRSNNDFFVNKDINDIPGENEVDIFSIEPTEQGIQEAADYFSTSRKQIRRVLRENGIDFSSTQSPNKEAELVASNDGMPWQSIRYNDPNFESQIKLALSTATDEEIRTAIYDIKEGLIPENHPSYQILQNAVNEELAKRGMSGLGSQVIPGEIFNQQDLDKLELPNFDRSVEPTQSHTGGEFDFNQDPTTLEEVQNRLLMDPDQREAAIWEMASDQDLLESAKGLQDVYNAEVPLDEHDLITLKAIQAEINRRGLQMPPETVQQEQEPDWLSQFADDNDIQASRVIPFGDTSKNKALNELLRREVPENIAQQARFLIEGGQTKAAMALLSEYPKKAFVETTDHVVGGRKIPITEPTKPQVYDLAEKLWINPGNENLAIEAEHLITKEKDLEIIKDNVRQLWEYAEQAKKSKDNDRIETFGFLHDVALDHMRMKQGAQIDTKKKQEQQSMADFARNVLGDENLANEIDEAFNGAKLRLVSDSDKNTDERYKLLENKLRNQQEDPDEPQFARTEDGKVKVSFNVDRAARQLAKDYSYPLPGIMVREAVQNAVDAVKRLGTKGELTMEVYNQHMPNGKNETVIHVSDSGPGMGRKELETVFTDLFDSGKANDKTASGGKGVGKATYMLGGRYFEAESVVRENGVLKMYSFRGTRDELMQGFDIHESRVPNQKASTGVTIRTYLDHDVPDTQFADYMIDNILDYSRDLPVTINYTRRNGLGGDGQMKMSESKSFKDDKIVFEGDVEGNDVVIAIPKGSSRADRDFIVARILNNGLYQYQDYISIGEKTEGIPEEVIIDVRPKAEEGEDAYPFPITRESMKEKVNEKIKELVKRHISNPLQKTRKNYTQELYDSMEPMNIPGTIRPIQIYDPGARLTPAEMQAIVNNPVMQEIARVIDDSIARIIYKVRIPQWGERLEKVGIILSPEAHGIHIPNPSTGRSAILINPFGYGANPEDTAWETIMTGMHEVAHIGSEAFVDAKINPAEFNDPRVGKYFGAYLKEVNEHGGINLGHGVAFLKRLGEVFAKYGPKEAFDATGRIYAAVTDNTGQYRPEFQELLSIYHDSRGRAETKKDYLSSTGDKSKNNESDGEGNLQQNAGSGRNGSFTDAWNKVTGGSGGNIPPPPTKDGMFGDFPDPKKVPPEEIPEYIKKALNRAENIANNEGDPKKLDSYYRVTSDFLRTWLTSLDLSAPMRQGLGAITYKAWWTSWDDMLKAFGSDGAYGQVMDSIYEDPSGLFRKRAIPVMRNGVPYIDRKTGQPKLKMEPAWSEMAGIDLTDMSANPEELFRSSLAMRIPVAGRLVRASARAFSAFLNKVRADMFKSFVTYLQKEGRDPIQDPVILKAIGAFINTATGRGTLDINVPDIKIPGMQRNLINQRELSFNASARTMAEIFFAPKLASSRVQTYYNVFNPWAYQQIPKDVRHHYIRSLMGIAAAGLAFSYGLKMAGEFVDENVDVELDPRSSDFLKARIGNTRFDAFGGYQQYVVAAARLIAGESKSSMSGNVSNLTKGEFGRPTRQTVVERFFANKLAPIPAFIWSWFDNKNFDGTPFDVKRQLMEATTPLILQDMAEIYGLDPSNPYLNMLQLPPEIAGRPFDLIKLIPPVVGVGVQEYGDKKRSPFEREPMQREPR